VTFPLVENAPIAAAAGAYRAYDANGDGLADFFTFADESGRIVSIGYDTGGDERPDTVVDLDAIPFSRCRHLVLILDGFGYDVLDKYYRDGGLRLFHKPSRVIAPYPTITDLAIQDVIGGMPCPAFEAEYFDRGANKKVGGAMAYLEGRNEPYNRVLQYRAGTILDAVGYVVPWAVFNKEINDAKRAWDERASKEFIAYFVSSAGVSTTAGAAGQVRCLERVEQLVNQILHESHGLVKVTLLADHGHSYTPGTMLDIAAYLKGKGWNLAKSLRTARDVVFVRFGLLTFASFCTRSPAELAADLAALDGVDVVSYAEGDKVIVLAPAGQRAEITRAGDRYGYKAISGDPLRIGEILKGLDAADGTSDGGGGTQAAAGGTHDAADSTSAADGTSDSAGSTYDGAELFRATYMHEYPAPLQRLWRAHFAEVDNPPDVMASLANNYFAGEHSFAGSVSVASTHGGLNQTNSTTFIMSSAGPLPDVMQSRDVSPAIERLTGLTTWPEGK
jgi:hypothetical protein